MELSNIKLANLQASPSGCFPWGTVASKAAQRKLKSHTCAAWGLGLWAQFALRGQERCASRTNNDVWCFNSSKNIAFSTLIFPQQTWTELPGGGILILKLPHWLLRKSARCDSRMQGVNAKLSPKQERLPLARAWSVRTPHQMHSSSP